jgi:hypothetical protein
MKFLAALLLLGATTVNAAPPPVAVTLTLPRTSVLPGVPFDIIVHFRNLSGHPVAVGRTAVVTVTPAGGAPVRMARFAHIDSPDASINEANVDLEPGEVRDGYISWDSNWFFDDAAVTVPGTYDIALDLSGNPNEVDDGVTLVGPVRTSSARLVRIDPTGDDAQVWHRLQEASNGEWPSHGFGSRAARTNVAAEVIASHPASGYFPYAVILNHDFPRLAVVRDAASRFKESPAYPHVLLTAARVASVEGRRAAMSTATAADAEQFLQLAMELSDSAARTDNPAVAGQARVVKSVTRSDLDTLRGARQRQ